MTQWFEAVIAEWSAYQLLGLGLVPALIVFFIMYFLLLGARSERRLAEWRLQDQQEDTDRLQANIKELESELKLLDDEKDHLAKQLVALSTQLDLQQQYKERTRNNKLSKQLQVIKSKF
ncbi:hypothetical protein OURE66S_02446 [Oligella ureolytica]